MRSFHLLVLVVFEVTSNAIFAFAQTATPTSLTAKQCQISAKERIVPNILGFAPEKAQLIVESCGLVYDPETVGTLSYEAIGTVGDQEPSGGTVAKAGAIVKGFVSRGLFVPDLIGWPSAQAESFLKDFRHGVNITKVDSPAPLGSVVYTVPSNAILYNSGLPVEIGVASLKVPELKGSRYKSAQAMLEDVSLMVKHVEGFTGQYYEPTNLPCEPIEHYAVVDRYEPTGFVEPGDVVSIWTKEVEEHAFIVADPDKDCE